MNGTRRTRPLRGPASYWGGLFQAPWGGAENWVRTSQTGVYFSATPRLCWTTLRWTKAKKQLSCIFSITMNDPGDRLFHLFSGSRIWTSRTNLFSESLGGLRGFTALAPVQFLVGGTEILKTMSHGPKKHRNKETPQGGTRILNQNSENSLDFLSMVFSTSSWLSLVLTSFLTRVTSYVDLGLSASKWCPRTEWNISSSPSQFGFP